MSDIDRDRLRQPPFYVLVLVAIYLSYLVLGPFLVPLAWAAVFAMLFHGPQVRLAARVGRSRAALLLTLVTTSGEASAAIGGTYTLNSIAAVVIGGTSLFGGSGSAVGSIFGAFVLRTIGDLLFVFDLEPFWQPLVQGIILLAAVSLGAIRLLRMRNRLDTFT